MTLPTCLNSEREFDYRPEHFQALADMACQHTGIQVSDDKYEMYYARLARLLRRQGFDSFSRYIDWIRQDEQAFSEFINAITTNVTAFNRESHHFDYLYKHLSKVRARSVAIWSAGCSSGEEPYSIVIALRHLCQQGAALQVVATDIDTAVLEKARAGIYPLSSIEVYSPATRKQCFLKGKGDKAGYCRVKDWLRQRVSFHQLNLISSWRMERQFDAIFCRNVMIYFDSATKTTLIKRFSAQLKPGGLLFLGHSESINQLRQDFRHVGKTIYQKR